MNETKISNSKQERPTTAGKWHSTRWGNKVRFHHKRGFTIHSGSRLQTAIPPVPYDKRLTRTRAIAPVMPAVSQAEILEQTEVVRDFYGMRCARAFMHFLNWWAHSSRTTQTITQPILKYATESAQKLFNKPPFPAKTFLNSNINEKILSFLNPGTERTQASIGWLGTLYTDEIFAPDKTVRDQDIALWVKELYLNPLYSLKEINLSHSSITLQGLRALLHSGNCDSVERLNLSNMHLGAQGAEVLANHLPKMKHLKVLNLSSTQITSQGAISLAKALPEVKQLRALHLGNNMINDPGATAIGSVLRATGITELSVNDNHIGIHGASMLARGIYLSKLEHLNIISNPVSDAGAKELAEMLSRSFIKYLFLYKTGITDVGASYLAAALPFATSLKALGLYHNEIGDAGAYDLVSSLQFNHALLALDLRRNKLTTIGIDSLDALIGKNCIQFHRLQYRPKEAAEAF